MGFLQSIQKYRVAAASLIISALLAPILQTIVSEWVVNTWGQRPDNLLRIFVFLLVILAIFVVIQLIPEREILIPAVTTKNQPPAYPGLIVLVSRPNPKKAESSHEVAIKYHLEAPNGGQRLRVCWLIASRGINGTEPEAIQIQGKYADRCDMRVCTVADPFDASEVYEVVNEIYSKALQDRVNPLRADQIIADFTGGTSPMSAGIVLAGTRRKPLQYIYGGQGTGATSLPIWVEF